MAASITCVPAAPISHVSAARIDIAGADPTIKSYIYIDPGSTAGSPGTSQRFYVDVVNGEYSMLSHIFDAAGSWTIRLRKDSDNSDITTLSVTVS